jgi:serine-type D-Ala-D-Ala carboxypeptidase (penicillin-binding protein 5/6)
MAFPCVSRPAAVQGRCRRWISLALAAAAVTGPAAASPPDARLAGSGTAAAADTRAPHVASSGVRDLYPTAATAYALAVDNELLWGRNLHVRRAPASLTKLLTALVLLDSHWNPDALVPVSDESARATRPRLGVRAGDSLRAADALNAMLVQSANDACLALVQHAATRVTEFAGEMNQRARQLGMRDSSFVNPCGFDAAGQYSTAADLLLLARAAYAEPRIARIVGQAHGVLRTNSGMDVSFANTNQLLGRLEGVLGLKTGYTAQAGYCLIALDEQSGHRVWLVMLDARQRWWSAHQIISDAVAVMVARDTFMP